MCQGEKVEKTKITAAPANTKLMTKWNKPISHFKALNLINQLFLSGQMRKMMSDKWGQNKNQETDTESGTETGSETGSSSETGRSEASISGSSDCTRSKTNSSKELKIEKNAPEREKSESGSIGSETGSSEYTGSGSSEYTDSEYDSETGSSTGNSEPNQGAVGMFMKMQMRQMQQIGIGPKVPPPSNMSNPTRNPNIEPKGKVELEREASKSENESENDSES